MDRFILIMAVVRGVQLVALLSLFGTLVFATVLAPQPVQERLTRLARGSAVIAFVAAAVWLTLEAAAIAGADTVGDTLSALPLVVTDTRFGQFVAARLVLLVAVLPLTGSRQILRIGAVVLAGAAVALQAAIGHVGAVGGGLGAGLVVSESLHLLAAGAWLGGLLPLLLSLRILPAKDAADVFERFTPIGLAAVLIIVGTALAQGLQLIGSVAALFGTDYGRVALLKAGLFLVALVFAARNRLALTDRLSGKDPDRAKRQMRQSLTGETTVGLLIILAAAVLASLPPGAHEQPVWPFPVRFSLAAMAEPDLRREVVMAVAVTAVGLAAVAASLIWRRLRILAAVLAAALIAWWAPSLGLLLVEAYPTSFYTSPSGFAVGSIVHGKALFAANCADCHGETGKGDGPSAAHLAVRPADLTAPHLWEHSDGELFWWLSHGVDDPEGGLSMPGFADRLSPADRWALIDFVRAQNLGVAMPAEGAWPQPVPAPDLPIQCDDDDADQASGLHGKAVVVIADSPPSGQAASPPVPPQAGFPVIFLHLGHVVTHGGCVADTPDAWPAFAILAGVPPDRLSGTAFLVDPNGWLRTILPADAELDADRLAATLRNICEHPISTSSGGGHEHHH
jgi:putative copper export protein/mono/diheme cytochrome c family protein